MKTQRPIIGIFFEDIGCDAGTSYYIGAGVVSITEHQPAGGLDRWFYDVEFSDGHMERIFNFTQVVFGKETK